MNFNLKNWHKVILIFILCLSISCRENVQPKNITLHSGTSQNQNGLDLSGIYKLVSYNGERVAAGTVYGGDVPQPYLTFDTTSKIASGHTGCNSFTLTFKIDGDAILLGKRIEKTEKACEPGADWENQLVELLSGASGQLNNPDELSLRNRERHVKYIRN